MAAIPTPQSCDSFVVLPPLTQNGAVIFGKNSDRPQDEVQEVVYIPGGESSSPVQCTYIEVEGHSPTKSVILSKPNWMWGAEMGANDCGVVIGNEAVWTRDEDGEHDPSVKRLLGMDLVRLGLERSSNSTEALEVITSLLEKHGQGGPCSNSDTSLNYHNSFLIADAKLSWVLETSGKHWAAVKVTSGYKNISNALTITSQIDRKSSGLEDYAKLKGLWDGSGDFNFAAAFSGTKPGCARQEAGEKLLEKLTENKGFRETSMFEILRDKPSDICRGIDSGFPTQGSQVSVLTTEKPNVHWFTATPDPSKSVFKPFIFTKNAMISKHTKSVDAKTPHTLYLLQSEAAKKDGEVQTLLRNMEKCCVEELQQVLQNMGEDLSEFDELLKDCVETEVKFYR